MGFGLSKEQRRARLELAGLVVANVLVFGIALILIGLWCAQTGGINGV